MEYLLHAVTNNILSKFTVNHSFAEIITIELCLSPRSLYLSCVYNIAPNCSDANHQHLFDHLNAQSSGSGHDALFVGDFNAPDISRSMLRP